MGMRLSSPGVTVLVDRNEIELERKDRPAGLLQSAPMAYFQNLDPKMQELQA